MDSHSRVPAAGRSRFERLPIELTQMIFHFALTGTDHGTRDIAISVNKAEQVQCIAIFDIAMLVLVSTKLRHDFLVFLGGFRLCLVDGSTPLRSVLRAIKAQVPPVFRRNISRLYIPRFTSLEGQVPHHIFQYTGSRTITGRVPENPARSDLDLSTRLLASSFGNLRYLELGIDPVEIDNPTKITLDSLYLLVQLRLLGAIFRNIAELELCIVWRDFVQKDFGAGKKWPQGWVKAAKAKFLGIARDVVPAKNITSK